MTEPDDVSAPVLPARSDDDTDVGWGDELADPAAGDRRYEEDVPPHWEP